VKIAASTRARTQTAALRAQIARYQYLCGAAYQLAGAVGAPERWLDALYAGSAGAPPSQSESLNLLPVAPNECDRVDLDRTFFALDSQKFQQFSDMLGEPSDGITIEESSGNVFADLGFPDAEERLARATAMSQRFENVWDAIADTPEEAAAMKLLSAARKGDAPELTIEGHRAVITFDAGTGLFRGEFVGLSGGADFYATDLAGLEREGAASLREFLAVCAERGIDPQASA
jgi:hypothetical protein